MPRFNVTAPDGTAYAVDAPDSATALANAQAQHAPQPEQPNAGLRLANAVGQGVNNSVAEGLGYLPDKVAWALRSAGLPAPSDPDFYANALKTGMHVIGSLAAKGVAMLPGGGTLAAPAGGAPQAQDWTENAAYGAGHGLGDAALMTTGAGALAPFLQAGSLPARAAGMFSASPLSQAAQTATAEAVGGAADDPNAGLATAAALPLLALAARRAVTPFPAQMTPEKARLAAQAAAENIPLSPAQQTGNRNLATVDSVLSQLPVSSGMSAAENQLQREAFNRAVLSRAGISGNYASPDVLDTAGKDLGDEFETLSANNQVQLGPAFQNDIADVVSQYQRKLPSQQREVFQNYVDDLNGAGNTMPGTVYQTARSDLSRQAKAIAGTDPVLSNALGGLRDALDAAMAASLPPDQAAQWADLRQRYGNYKAITSAMNQPGADAASGNIPPAALWMSVRSQNPANFPRGAGDLNDLARIGQAFIKPQVADFGTAQRAFWTNVLSGGALGAMSAGLASGHPDLGAAATAPFVLPAIIKSAMASDPGRAWLTNQLLAGKPSPFPNMGAMVAARGGQPPQDRQPQE